MLHSRFTTLTGLGLGLLLVPLPALGTASAPVTVGGSVVSYGGSVVLAGGGGVATGYGISKPSGWFAAGGVLALGGAFIIGFVDPSSATFYDGAVTFHYDPSLLDFFETGWLGDWGVDPSKKAPPVDSNLWDGVTVFLQAPAGGLTSQTKNNPAGGTTEVTFTWGATGKQATAPDPFNMLGISFTVLQDSRITYLGNFAAPPPGSNLYVSSPGISCTFPEDPTKLQLCGESTTSYFRISAVPELSSFALVAIGALGWLTVRAYRCQRAGS